MIQIWGRAQPALVSFGPKHLFRYFDLHFHCNQLKQDSEQKRGVWNDDSQSANRKGRRTLGSLSNLIIPRCFGSSAVLLYFSIPMSRCPIKIAKYEINLPEGCSTGLAKGWQKQERFRCPVMIVSTLPLLLRRQFREEP